MSGEGLTEAERLTILRAVDEFSDGRSNYGAVYSTVERVLAVRLAAGRAERDEAYEKGYWVGYREGKDEAETRDLDFDRLTDERDAALADLEALRDRVDKIARNPYARDVADMLRAAVEGGAA